VALGVDRKVGGDLKRGCKGLRKWRKWGHRGSEEGGGEGDHQTFRHHIGGSTVTSYQYLNIFLNAEILFGDFIRCRQLIFSYPAYFGPVSLILDISVLAKGM